MNGRFRFAGWRPICTFLALAFLTTAPAAAQRYLVRTYTEADGLPSNNIKGILQDPAGRLWFATPRGLASYDGTVWTHVLASQETTLRDPHHLVMDETGTLWSASAQEPLHIFSLHGDRWEPFPSPPSTGTSSAAVVGFAVSHHQGKTFLLAITGDHWLRYWNGETWSSQRTSKETPPMEPLILKRVAGQFFMGTARGLVILKPSGSTLERTDSPALPPGPVAGIQPAKDGTWLVGSNWLGKLQEGKFHLFLQHQEFGLLPDWTWLVTASDGQGGLYFGNPSGLLQFQPGSGLHHLDHKNGLISESTTALFRDREDNLWVGNFRGVTKLVSRRLASYDKESGLFDDEVSAILERRAGGLVLGHPGGLTLLGQTIVPLKLAGNDIEGRVLDLAEDPDGTVWIAANRLGLLALAPDGSIHAHPLSKGPAETTSVLVDPSGQLWATTTEHLYRRISGSFHLFHLPRATPEPSPMDPFPGFNRRLFQAGNDTLWLATDKGLWRIRSGSAEPLTCRDRPGCNDIYALFQDHRHETWIGTRAGLYHLASGRMQPAARPALSRPVYFILEDAGEDLWFGTDDGVRRWDGESLKSYSVHDGLAGFETNRAAGLLDSRGRVWIGTDGGVSVYDAGLDRPRTGGPQVTFLTLEAGDERLNLSSNLRLDHNHNDLVFHFRATAFVDEQRVKFRYKLDGFDAAWQGPRLLPLRELRYTNLGRGSYRLHLQALDVEGRRSPVAISPQMMILAPVWRQTWFRLLVLGMALAFVWGLVSFMLQRRYNKRLKIEIQVRTRQLETSQAEVARARRIEAMGLLAGGIAHDFNNLLTGIMGNISLLQEAPDLPDSLRKQIAAALQAAERARSLTQQLLTFSRGGAPQREVGDISEVIRESATFSLHGSNIQHTIDLPGDLFRVKIDTGQMSQVFNNLLLNARQSMPHGGTLTVRGTNLEKAPPGLPDGRSIRIDITDTGKGIPKENLDRIFDPFFTTKKTGTGLGLSTAHSIVKRHQGRLSVEPAATGGTTFHLDLPATSEPLAARPRPAPPGPGSPAHILVVDDQQIIQDVVKDMLTLRGHSVACATDGDTAIALYREAQGSSRPFDAVIMDLTLPGGMGGHQIMERLRSLDPDVRAVVASGYSSDSILAQHLKHGFRARVAKPFDGEQLMRALEKAMAGAPPV